MKQITRTDFLKLLIDYETISVLTYQRVATKSEVKTLKRLLNQFDMGGNYPANYSRFVQIIAPDYIQFSDGSKLYAQTLVNSNFYRYKNKAGMQFVLYHNPRTQICMGYYLKKYAEEKLICERDYKNAIH